MLDFLAPSSDSLPKYITTWGVFSIVFSMAYYDYWRRKYQEDLFAIRERLDVLRTRVSQKSNNRPHIRSGIEGILAMVKEKLATDKDAAYAIDQIRRIEGTLDAEDEAILSIAEESSRVQVLADRLEYYKNELNRVFRLRLLLLVLGLVLTGIGVIKWQEAERDTKHNKISLTRR